MSKFSKILQACAQFYSLVKSAEEQLSLFSDEDLEYHSNVKDKTSLKYQLIRLRSAMARAAQLV